MRSSYIDIKRTTAVTLFAVTGLVVMPSLASAAEAAAKDEVFSATAVISLPGGKLIKAFDISFVDSTLSTYVLGDRTNQAVDVVNTKTLGTPTLLTATPPFAGATGNNATSGPDGVLIVRANNNGDNTDEVWAGDGPSNTKLVPPPTACSLTATSTVPQSPPTDKNC